MTKAVFIIVLKKLLIDIIYIYSEETESFRNKRLASLKLNRLVFMVSWFGLNKINIIEKKYIKTILILLYFNFKFFLLFQIVPTGYNIIKIL